MERLNKLAAMAKKLGIPAPLRWKMILRCKNWICRC